MGYVTEQLLAALKEARVRKGLSQRALGVRSGVPQSHISKIEAGDVDLRMSSLIALARVLDLELFVAPKKSATAIKSIIDSSNGAYNQDDEPLPAAYNLDGDENDE